MIATLPNVSVNGRYSISEAAIALGVHRNTMRSYLKRGLINFGIRKATNRIFISGKDIINFWQKSY